MQFARCQPAFLNPCLHSCPPGCSPPADPSGLVVFRAWRLAAFSGSLSLYFYLSIPFSTTLWLFQPYKKSFRASMSQQNLPCCRASLVLVVPCSGQPGKRCRRSWPTGSWAVPGHSVEVDLHPMTPGRVGQVTQGGDPRLRRFGEISRSHRECSQATSSFGQDSHGMSKMREGEHI